MCLVVFQKIFRKIFYGVWKMLQGKRQNQKNKHSTQIDARDQRGSTARCFASSSPTTAPSIVISLSLDRDRRKGKITIDDAILQSTALIAIGAKASSRSRIAIDGTGACERRGLELGACERCGLVRASPSRFLSLSL